MLYDKSVTEVNKLAASVLQPSDVHEPHISSRMLHESRQEGLRLRIRVADLENVERNALLDHLLLLQFRDHAVLMRYANLIVNLLYFE